MQLQKLVFIAHGFYMVYFNGTPLISEEIKAWQWGPVIPPLYNKLKKHGSLPISEPMESNGIPSPESNESKLISSVWNVYKGFTGMQLSAITHRDGSPWKQVWDSAPFSIIPKDLISSYYSGLIAKK